MLFWQEALKLNPTTELLKMAPTSWPQFPHHSKRFSEVITSASLHGVSASSVLPNQELPLGPFPFYLPISSCQFSASARTSS